MSTEPDDVDPEPEPDPLPGVDALVSDMAKTVNQCLLNGRYKLYRNGWFRGFVNVAHIDAPDQVLLAELAQRDGLLPARLHFRIDDRFCDTLWFAWPTKATSWWRELLRCGRAPSDWDD